MSNSTFATLLPFSHSRLSACVRPYRVACQFLIVESQGTNTQYSPLLQLIIGLSSAEEPATSRGTGTSSSTKTHASVVAIVGTGSDDVIGEA